jgi:putative DNA primase/helicase
MSARELAERFGLHRNGREWRGTCPACGYADSFVVGDGKVGPIGWCASCGDQDAIWAAIREPGALPPRPRERDAEHDRGAQRKLERLTGLWDAAMPVPGTPAAAYLASRGLEHLTACRELRFHPVCAHPASKRDRPIRLPAMIAAVRDVDGRFIALHRTYLRRDGSGKADIDPPRASLGPIMGGAVRLASLDQVLVAGELVLGEGGETSASAGLLLGLPAWSAVSAGNLARSLALPAEVRRVLIAADRDPPDERGRHPGQDAARAASARFRAEGRAVRVALPDQDRGDFNDILAARGALS